jgi:hypothetical protein
MQSGCPTVDRHVACVCSSKPSSNNIPGDLQSRTLSLPISEKCHAGHGRHVASLVAAVAFEYFPNTQSSHTDLDTAPRDCAYFPAAHISHAELPQLSAYFPIPQSRHASEANDPEYLPALQSWHTDIDVAATVEEDVPAAHSAHTLLPALSPYFPF